MGLSGLKREYGTGPGARSPCTAALTVTLEEASPQLSPVLAHNSTERSHVHGKFSNRMRFENDLTELEVHKTATGQEVAWE